MSEGTYDVMVSVWNPLDGFRHSAPTVIKVMERIGPIWIDDFQMVTDHVRKRQIRSLNSKAMGPCRHKGPSLNDVLIIFGFLEPLPHSQIHATSLTEL